MRLAGLEPKWVGLNNWASLSPFYIGVRFNCPHCLTQKLAVLFSPPIDPEGVEATFGQPIDFAAYANDRRACLWTRVSGDTFDTLTLTPSVDAQSFAGHWHGFIENGEIR